MNIKKYAGLILSVVVLTFSNMVFAFDSSTYTLSTIEIEFNRIETDHTDTYKNVPGDGKSINILVHPMVPFSIIAEYLNEERDLSEDNQKGLDVFAKTFNEPSIFDIYQHEVLIRDSDNHEYWLPIQENFIEYLHAEYFEGCKLTLYLLISVIYDHKPLVLINEFLVQENDSSYLQNGPSIDPKEFSEFQIGNSYEVDSGIDVCAVQNGKVSRLSNNPYNQTNLGKFVELEHTKGYIEDDALKTVTFYTVYAFLSEVSVKMGGTVSAGDILGKTGKSGPLANQNYKGEFLFCLYSYKDEPIIEQWTQSQPVKKFGVYWYNPSALFNLQ